MANEDHKTGLGATGATLEATAAPVSEQASLESTLIAIGERPAVVVAAVSEQPSIESTLIAIGERPAVVVAAVSEQPSIESTLIAIGERSAVVPAGDLAATLISRGNPIPKEPVGLKRGSSVGRYVVLGELGAGGKGVVHAAYDPELDRKVALKLLRPELGARARPQAAEQARMRLLREAQALAKLGHPNVVAIHDVGTLADGVWLAMEFVEGETLGAWAARRRSWREVLEVMRAAARGLAAAHAAGLVHRDFKPESGRFSFRTPSSRETPRISSLEGVRRKIGSPGLTLNAPG